MIAREGEFEPGNSTGLLASVAVSYYKDNNEDPHCR